EATTRHIQLGSGEGSGRYGMTRKVRPVSRSGLSPLRLKPRARAACVSVASLAREAILTRRGTGQPSQDCACLQLPAPFRKCGNALVRDGR
ncbi:hypothetical protein B5181_42965, partial [Streptomyces sp. 4F]